MLEQLVSGGQTGADLAALDAAIEHGFPHGGWCPKGRINLNGRLPDVYQLRETPSASYLQRTEWNVRDSDGTVVFTMASPARGGSQATLRFCDQHHKPCLHLTPEDMKPEAALMAFIGEHDIRILNVAGSREQKEPGIHQWVKWILERALFGVR